ncbi:MAG: tetratricopeptide repeat protein [Alphaproteobacteria bacterium]
MALRTVPIAGARVIALILLGALAGCQSGEKASQTAMHSKVALTEQKNNIASLSEVIKANPRDANALNLRGAAYGQAGQYQKALADFNAAISTSPRYYQAYANRALIYSRMKQPKKALADYNQALSIEPKYTTALVGRGTIYRLHNNHPAAVADFSKAIEVHPDAVAFFNRGLSRQALGRHGQAMDDFENTLGFRPNAPEVYHAKGISELALQKYEKAYNDFYKAARGRANNYEAWALRGRAAEGMGQMKEAAQAYQRALQINPTYQPAREGLDRVRS